MKLGLASTKCGSSVGFASIVSSILSPPISLAIAAMSGVVATTFNLAYAVAEINAANRIERYVLINLCFICVNLWQRFMSKFVRAMRAEEKFELHPDRMRVAELRVVIVVVLQ